MKYNGTEAAFQATIARHLNLSGVLWCHVPNEARRTAKLGGKLKRQGMKAGVPDILIFEPHGKWSGLAIELKVGSNKASDVQKQWLGSLKNCGWLCMVSNDIDAVLETIDDYLKLSTTKKDVI